MVTPARSAARARTRAAAFAARARGPLAGLCTVVAALGIAPAAAHATSPGAAAALRQTTGLAPSQVTSAAVCPTAPAGYDQCEAQAVVLSSTGQAVHPSAAPQATFTQVFPSSASGTSASRPNGSAVGMTSAAASPPQAGTPAFLQQAYDLTYLSQTAGGSDTVAIVDAYDDPTAESDLATYRTNWGLFACTTANGCFRKVNQNGQSSPMPAADANWSEEISLDLDAVSALCPNCHILLVEANTNSSSDLYTAVGEARTLGANQISNSWAGSSSSASAPPSYPGVSLVAATGDHGYAGPGWDNYPAAFPNFTAAGGTSLSAVTTNARGFSESAWSLSSGWGGGSGCDTNETRPSFQASGACTGRAYSDVSADADPNTGLIMYDAGSWYLIGGTSLATPLIAAYEAVTGTAGTTPQWAYTEAGLLNDPMSGSTGSCAASISYVCTAGPGYDGPTGAGSISGAVASSAPGVGASSAQNVTASSAALAGGVYPNGNDTTYLWQYGTTPNYGQSTSASDIGAGTVAVTAPATVTGLTPGTTYHYRLVAQNSLGTVYGYDYTFTTTTAPTPPPVNGTAPSVSGTAMQGQGLSAAPGSWTPTSGVTFTYQWRRSPDGTTWSNIPGATAQSYTLAAADVGDEVDVVVTATDAGGAAVVSSSAVGPVASGAPYNSVAPAVTGTAAQGNVLGVTSTWSPAGTSYAYQWQRSSDGGATWANITGATRSSYTVGVADEGASLRVAVTATNAYGQATAASPGVGPASANPPVNTAAPAVTGTTQRTYVLTATRGTWTGPGLSYAYQWQRSADGTTWTAISGATGPTYTLAAGDEGDQVRVVVSASNLDGVVTAPSAPTLLISPFPPGNLSAPTLSGTAERTYTLNATIGTWTGPDNTYTYQWQRDFGEGFVDITGASASTYTLGVADEGAAVRVVVTATNPDATIVEASQPTTTVLDAVPVNQSAPTLIGNALRSSTLSATTGTWGGAGNTYAYQWQASSDGNTWTNISGATGPNHAIGVGDEGSELRVLVTATNPDGSATAASTATTMIQAAPPVNTAAPTIAGTAQRSFTLSSSPGTWTGIGNTYAYQWQRSSDGSTWTNIPGATGTGYTLTTADEGDAVRLLLTATNPDSTVSAASASSATVQAAPPLNATSPTVTGTPQRSSVLTASTGTWTGIGNTYAYQWQRSSDGTTWANIGGATAQTYTLGVTDEANQIRVVVTGSNPDGALSAASAPTLGVAAAPPVSTTSPTVSGTIQRGAILTATPGGWGGIGNTYADQWQRSADGTTWANITGATGLTYQLAVADEGDVVRVLITATNPDGTLSAASAATGTIPSAAPVNTVLPTVVGTAQRGIVLGSTAGTWGGLGNTYAYQWQRSSDGSTWSNISGATGGTYALGVADEGDAVRVVVTASNPDGSVSVPSLASAPVQATAPANTTAPTIAGSAQRTGVLSSTQGAWSGIGNVYSYQWQHDTGSGFTDITGATGITYVLGVADEGSRIRLVVTASNPDGSLQAASTPTATVAAAPPVNTVPPTVTGTAERSFTVTSTQGTWTGIGNAYALQWQRSADGGTTWTDVTGATGASYTLAVADEGDLVRLQVTASNPDGTASVSSAPTATVLAAPPANSAAPTITGSAVRSSVLTSTQGTWSGLGNTYAYQWQRSADGTTWANISGATGQTYALAVADEGDAVRLVVSATNPDGSLSVPSAATATVTAAPPVLTTAPVLTGTAQRSFTLSATQGAWTGVGNAYVTQWQRSTDNGQTWSNVSGATGLTYTLGVSDENSELRLLVTASNPDGSASSATNATTAVTAAPPLNTSVPTVTGTAQRTQTLTAAAGTWSGIGNAYADQWQRSSDGGTTWTDIAGATAQTYTPVMADEGDNLRVEITASNPDGAVTAPSAGTAAVQSAPPVNTTLPAITGSARTGATLTVSAGSWSPAGATFTYAWQRGDATNGYQTVAGATGTTYTLTGADVGETLRAIVTATNPDGTTSVTSAATATVAAPPQNLSAPAAPSGTLMDSYTLTPDPGTWSTAAAFSYAWLRCPTGATSVTGACVQVGTGSSYVLSSSDVGHLMGVTVTATAAGGSTIAQSALTAAVAGRPLTNVLAPSISGDPQIPQTLTANAGSWSVPLTSISYDWERCGPGGTMPCTQVASNTSRYTLSTTDLGSTIVLVATASSPGRTASAQSTPLTVQAQPLPQPSQQPSIGGVAARAQTLRVYPGAWTNSPTSLSYQWRRCDSSGQNCQNISAAIDQTYVPGKADEGSKLTVAVTAGNASGTATATAPATSVVAAAPPVNTHIPVVQGTTQQGGGVTAAAATWQATSDTTYATQWQRCAADGTGCVNITGAVGTTYSPLAADVGHTLVAVTTATNPDAAVPAASQPSSVILPAAPRWKALPTISQDPGHVGDDVAVTPGTWSGPSVSTDTVELIRCTNVCIALPLGSGNTYTIAAGDVGGILRVRETASNPGGTTVVWSSYYVGPVGSAISGSAVLASGQATLRNSQGVALAVAQLTNALAMALDSGTHKKPTVVRRQLRLQRARGVTGSLRVWVCPMSTSRAAAPAKCTRRVTLRSRATLTLPATMQGKVRIVVVRVRR
jgi:hypothetical protein